MNPMSYDQMSDLALLQLALWREARGEPYAAKLAVAHSISNRSLVSCWWNDHTPYSAKAVILHKWQYSSFNPGDPNETKWPADDDPSFAECCAAALAVMSGRSADTTNGATNYFDTSIEWPKAWGEQSEWINTLDVGRLRFWRQAPATSYVDTEE